MTLFLHIFCRLFKTLIDLQPNILTDDNKLQDTNINQLILPLALAVFIAQRNRENIAAELVCP